MPEKNENPHIVKKYIDCLDISVAWLQRSIYEDGGSSAYSWAWGQWANSYPETTGYLIPTFLNYAKFSSSREAIETARKLGSWLLSIQDNDGYWHGMMHPPSEHNPSVFNTAQILLGLCTLHRIDESGPWLCAAQEGARWLTGGLNSDGQWPSGNYKGDFNPSYYTRVAWPLLEVWELTGESDFRTAAETVLARVLDRRTNSGSFRGWGFEPDASAYTHTIAYTLRGFLESARILDDWDTYGKPAEKALSRLYRHAELSNGELPGAYGMNWEKGTDFTCLTGNAQVAICLLRYDSYKADLRLVNAACKLVDGVADSQLRSHPVPGLRGAIPGSKPFWGRYMRFRYPNWAVKFFCDALLLLIKRLRERGL